MSELDVAVFSVFSFESPNSHKVVTWTRLGFFSIGPPFGLSVSNVCIWHVLCSLLLNMAVLFFPSNVHKVVTLIRFGALWLEVGVTDNEVCDASALDLGTSSTTLTTETLSSGELPGLSNVCNVVTVTRFGCFGVSDLEKLLALASGDDKVIMSTLFGGFANDLGVVGVIAVLRSLWVRLSELPIKIIQKTLYKIVMCNVHNWLL